MEHKLELGDDDVLAYESLMMKNELQNWSLGDGFGDGRKLGLGFGFFLS